MSDATPSDHDPSLNEPARPATPPPASVLRTIADPARALPFGSLSALSSPDDDTVARIIALWPGLPADRRRELVAALHQRAEDDPTLDFNRIYLSALHDPDVATRILAIRALWEYERPELADVLIDLLAQDPEPAVRAEAALALGHFVVSLEFGLLPEELGERISDALRDRIDEVTEEDEVRGAALEAVGPYQEEWVAEVIAEYYEAGTTRMRLAAVRAMGRHASDDWLPVLIQTFDDDDEEVRAAAAASAGNLLLEAAVEPLTLLLEDEDEDVQVAAVRALGEIAGQRAERILTDLLDNGPPHISAAAALGLEEARMMSVEPAEDPR